jgi:hypothetical protein
MAQQHDPQVETQPEQWNHGQQDDKNHSRGDNSSLIIAV